MNRNKNEGKVDLTASAPVILDVAAVPEAVQILLQHWGNRAGELREGLISYVTMLLEANQQFNLTGNKTPERQWNAHVGDALQCSILIESFQGLPDAGTRILDIGSGGGVPGLIWAMLWPQAEVVLIEATGKKARFLERVAKELELARVRVIHNRAEDAARLAELRGEFAWVSARAVAPLERLAEWTMSFLKPGGYLFAIKSSGIADEMLAAEHAFKKAGAAPPPMCLGYTRPDAKECQLIAYKKAADRNILVS